MNTVRVALLAGAVSCLAPLAALAAPVLDADGCPTGPAPQPTNSLVRFAEPGAQVPQFLRFETLLRIAYDRCGMVTRVRVEKASTDAGMDRWVVANAYGWRMSPVRRAGAPLPGSLRLPVSSRYYEMGMDLPVAVDDPDAPPPRWDDWRDRLVETIPVDARGDAPGFLPDPEPMSGTVAAIVEMLRDEGQLRVRHPTEREYLTQERADLLTSWRVVTDDQVDAIVRTRWISDDAKAAEATAILCEPKKPGACERFVESERATRRDPQKVRLPLPWSTAYSMGLPEDRP